MELAMVSERRGGIKSVRPGLVYTSLIGWYKILLCWSGRQAAVLLALFLVAHDTVEERVGDDGTDHLGLAAATSLSLNKAGVFEVRGHGEYPGSRKYCESLVRAKDYFPMRMVEPIKYNLSY